MVFGIGEGSIDIVVDKTSFSRGETIKGKVIVRLNQPKKARGLRISLIAEKEVWVRDSRGKKEKHTETVFSSPVNLDTEKEYPSGESSYEFSVAVPDIPQASGGGGLSMSIGGLSFSVGGAPPVKWRLDASLDLSMSFDINRKLPITVS